LRAACLTKGSDFAGLIDAEAVDLVIAYPLIPDQDLRKSILAKVKKQAAAFSQTPKKPR
jgi:hypothetical protein